MLPELLLYSGHSADAGDTGWGKTRLLHKKLQRLGGQREILASNCNGVMSVGQDWRKNLGVIHINMILKARGLNKTLQGKKTLQNAPISKVGRGRGFIQRQAMRRNGHGSREDVRSWKSKGTVLFCFLKTWSEASNAMVCGYVNNHTHISIGETH